MPIQPDDGARISRTLRNAGLCLDCIVEGTGIPKPDARVALDRLGENVKVTLGQTICEACLKTKPVFRLV